MSGKGALGSIALAGALVIAAAAYAAQPSWWRSESGSRMMPMGTGMMMGPGMMAHGSMMGTTMPGAQMQEMMKQCQQLMQSWMVGPGGQGGAPEETPRSPDNPG